MEADEKKLLRRRNIFTTNASRKQKIKLIRNFSMKSEHVFRKCARKYNKPSKILMNKKGHAIEAAKGLNNFLELIS